MRKTRFEVRDYKSSDAKALTQLWRDSLQQVIHQAPIHSFESHQFFLDQILVKQFRVRVVVNSHDRPLGFIAYSETEINQLYLDTDYQGKGLGSVLVKEAQKHAPCQLSLRTFEINSAAIRFYRKHGFDFSTGDSHNEEALQDLVGLWRRQ